jgi:uncharacterized membrane protein
MIMTPLPGSGRHLWDHHPHVRSHDQLTFGERSADVMRNAFGSWAFVGAFLLFMTVWMLFNTVVLKQLGHKGFDPYPYILLNLALSMMAGLQGALILIAAKRADRVAAEQATAHYAETSKLDELLATNTTLTQQIRDQTACLEHVNAELNTIRAAVAPGVPNPDAGSDTAVRPGQAAPVPTADSHKRD